MNEMVERVARAVSAKHGLYWTEHVAVVKTALEAMREPTEAMLDVACEVGPDTNQGEFDMDSARSVYGAMIDAALTEGR